MPTLRDTAARIIDLRASKGIALTLLAACPNSDAVLEAAVAVAARNGAPMLFAATLNQVDCDGGYTGWTPARFVQQMQAYAQKHHCTSPLYPCLDHGGPWLKDRHTAARLPLAETMAEVKKTLTACLEAGYSLLHVDCTVDRELAPGRPLPIEDVVARTAELIAHCEAERRRLAQPPVDYEVGTEEVHGGLVDRAVFEIFLHGLRGALDDRGLREVWPCFIVGKVGTDLGTTYFDPQAARELCALVTPLGSLVKGHYTDWVDNPEDYPASGMGGANVGPEFTSVEHQALLDLATRERDLLRSHPGRTASGIDAALERAVVASGRWQKWLRPEEKDLPFDRLSPARRSWLVQTGVRYIWTDPAVLAARARLYENTGLVLDDPHRFVVERVVGAMEKYVTHFHLFGACSLLG